MSPIPNVQEYSVSELSGQLRRTVEDAFGYVRVRGELGRVMKAGSGHMYLDLKDERAVLSGVIWKGNAGKLSVRPEQGMEVVVTGRLTTFPGQSKYQIVIETLEPAGAGALMALYEERKKKLAAEGLFAEERKRPIPFLPSVIGVVTSPSGAVIRDILHRLRDRFPVHVLVWPTLVQGQGAARQIVAGIEGFNALPQDGPVPRPDVLIVARGGGSLEDLWCFNEEEVARAAAASVIPLISAVGHETDTTLIDFVADRRAPTPTAAAEIAVPVRSELMTELLNKARRLTACAQRTFESRRVALESARRGLGRPETILEIPSQRLDHASGRLSGALTQRLEIARGRLAVAAAGARPQALDANLRRQGRNLSQTAARLGAAGGRIGLAQRRQLEGLRLPRTALETRLKREARGLAESGNRLVRAGGQVVMKGEASLSGTAKLLESLSYRNVLGRGYALVIGEGGRVLRNAGDPAPGERAEIRFCDGSREAVFDAPGAEEKGGSAGRAASTETGKASGQGDARKKPAGKTGRNPQQKTLFD